MGIFSKIKKPYYYVPDCPCCGSPFTGRFIKERRFYKDNIWILQESFKNGEIVCLSPETDDLKNAFCLNCQYTWETPVETMWLTELEINRERVRRNTDALYDELYVSDEEKLMREQKKKSSLIKDSIKSFRKHTPKISGNLKPKSVLNINTRKEEKKDE